MNIGVKSLTRRRVLALIVGVAAVGGLTFLVWPEWELLLVGLALALYSFAAYQAGKMRRG